jgi:large subunit ribosomal protein L10Ae
MKKVLCIGVAVGTVNLTEAEINTNLTLAINTLIGLLKKGWQNVKSVHIKSTMGPAARIY